jgi:putative acyl-CoA dehydrogenase
MTDYGQTPRYDTQFDENQPPPLEGYNAFATDRALVDALAREGGDWGVDRAETLGAVVGSAEIIELAHQANRVPPELQSHDRRGDRIDTVEYHPAWHRLMAIAIEHETHALPWRESKPGAHAVRAALAFLMNQGENGVCCPVAMTFAAVPAIRQEPVLRREWEPRIVSPRYDQRFQAPDEKDGVTFGMALTEKQGGSDLRTTTTTAQPAAEGGDSFRLTGHKWFCSAPMSDAFLTLAQAPGGLTCFLVPRWCPDGAPNRFFIQRLKDKLGNRSNASAEIEYQDTWARRVGGEGEGIRTIISMVHHTRLDASISAAAIMRHAVVQALHHCRCREAFGERLDNQPMMRAVLADLAVETEAATAMVMRLARAFDEAERSPAKVALARFATAIVKYWVCKRAPVVVAEAMECLGGNGYVEDGPMARLYREAPVNGIWEGSGNVICLDALRTVAETPDALSALIEELYAARKADRRYDAYIGMMESSFSHGAGDPAAARRTVERLALAWQGALLLRHAPAPVADAFCASRLGGDWGRNLGTLPTGVDAEAIIARAWPL